MSSSTNSLSPAKDFARDELRSDLFLVAVLPLLEVVLAERPDVRKLVSGLSGKSQFEARGSDLAGRLEFDGDSLHVSFGSPEPCSLHFVFGTLGKMNDFFAGKPRFPWIAPWFGLSHPIMALRTLQLLMALQILEPPRKGAELPSPDERALRVRLLLYLVTKALERLHRRRFAPMVELAENSPDRVYQWTVVGTNIGAWVRMHKGRVKSGRGTCAARRPFVHFVFPDVDAAFAVLTATSSQMQGFRGGSVVTYGSPEYTRKMALLMQEVDKLLLEG
jgi:hypothetical protein